MNANYWKPELEEKLRQVDALEAAAAELEEVAEAAEAASRSGELMPTSWAIASSSTMALACTVKGEGLTTAVVGHVASFVPNEVL